MNAQQLHDAATANGFQDYKGGGGPNDKQRTGNDEALRKAWLGLGGSEAPAEIVGENELNDGDTMYRFGKALAAYDRCGFTVVVDGKEDDYLDQVSLLETCQALTAE